MNYLQSPYAFGPTATTPTGLPLEHPPHPHPPPHPHHQLYNLPFQPPEYAHIDPFYAPPHPHPHPHPHHLPVELANSFYQAVTLEDTENLSRPRLTKEQVDTLEAQFQAHPKPNSSVKRQLAMQTNLTLPRVANWFQNRRAKAKQQKRQAEYEKKLAEEKAEKEAASAVAANAGAGSNNSDNNNNNNGNNSRPSTGNGPTGRDEVNDENGASVKKEDPREGSDVKSGSKASASSEQEDYKLQTQTQTPSQSQTQTQQTQTQPATTSSPSIAVNVAPDTHTDTTPQNPISISYQDWSSAEYNPTIPASANQQTQQQQQQQQFELPFRTDAWATSSAADFAPRTAYAYAPASAGLGMPCTPLEDTHQSQQVISPMTITTPVSAGPGAHGMLEHTGTPTTSAEAYNANITTTPTSNGQAAQQQQQQQQISPMAPPTLSSIDTWRRYKKEVDIAARRKKPRPAAIGTAPSNTAATAAASSSNLAVNTPGRTAYFAGPASVSPTIGMGMGGRLGPGHGHHGHGHGHHGNGRGHTLRQTKSTQCLGMGMGMGMGVGARGRYPGIRKTSSYANASAAAAAAHAHMQTQTQQRSPLSIPGLAGGSEFLTTSATTPTTAGFNDVSPSLTAPPPMPMSIPGTAGGNGNGNGNGNGMPMTPGSAASWNGCVPGAPHSAVSVGFNFGTAVDECQNGNSNGNGNGTSNASSASLLSAMPTTPVDAFGGAGGYSMPECPSYGMLAGQPAFNAMVAPETPPPSGTTYGFGTAAGAGGDMLGMQYQSQPQSQQSAFNFMPRSAPPGQDGFCEARMQMQMQGAGQGQGQGQDLSPSSSSSSAQQQQQHHLHPQHSFEDLRWQFRPQSSGHTPMSTGFGGNAFLSPHAQMIHAGQHGHRQSPPGSSSSTRFPQTGTTTATGEENWLGGMDVDVDVDLEMEMEFGGDANVNGSANGRGYVNGAGGMNGNGGTALIA